MSSLIKEDALIFGLNYAKQRALILRSCADSIQSRIKLIESRSDPQNDLGNFVSIAQDFDVLAECLRVFDLAYWTKEIAVAHATEGKPATAAMP